MGFTDDFEKLIKPELKEQFELDKNNWFPRTDTAEHNWLTRESRVYLKLSTRAVVWLVYVQKHYCFGDKNNLSNNCTQKQGNADILNKETYKKCLMYKQQINCTNMCFRYIDNCMKTYQQEKFGLSSIYSKGIVFGDGIHIYPLII